MRRNLSQVSRIGVCGALFVYALLPVIAWATTIQVLSLEKLTRSSSVILRGKVTKIESFWNKDRTAIYSRISLQREEELKGTTQAEVQVFLPGGTVDGRTTIVIGAPEFKEGEEVVLFLSQATGYQEEVALPETVVPFRLTDLLQGKFNVVVDPATGRKMAVSSAAKLLERPGIKPEMLPPGGLKGLALTELVTKIRQIR